MKLLIGSGVYKSVRPSDGGSREGHNRLGSPSDPRSGGFFFDDEPLPLFGKCFLKKSNKKVTPAPLSRGIYANRRDFLNFPPTAASAFQPSQSSSNAV